MIKVIMLQGGHEDNNPEHDHMVVVPSLRLQLRPKRDQLHLRKVLTLQKIHEFKVEHEDSREWGQLK